MIIIPGIYNAQTHIPGGSVQGQVVTVGAILKVTERDRRPYPSDPGTPSEIWIDNTAAIGYVCKEVGPNGTVWDRLDVLGDYIAFGDSNPGPNADILWGYRPGSLRYARNTQTLWICDNNTQGAAIWSILGGGGGGAVDSVNGYTGVVVLALDDLSDVNVPSPSTNQFLKWNGSNWVSAFVNGTNGLQNDFATYDIKLGGVLSEATTITTGTTTPNNKLQIEAPTNTSTSGSFIVRGLNPSGTYTSSNNILTSFESNDIITTFIKTGSSFIGNGIGLYILSTNASCTPIVIYGSSALGSGQIFKVTDAGQLIMEEYNTSTAFQGSSGASVGVLNVDNTGKVFVGAGGGSGGGTLLALPFTTDHISATGNPYLIGDVVWYSGNVYRCIANNDSIIPTSPLYWVNLGTGFPLVQQPADWNSTSGNNQILNKPIIPSLTGYVPYTGATQDVDLGTHNLIADHIALNTNPSGAGFVVGASQWNNTIGSSETLLKGGNVILKNGVDLVARVVNKVVPNTTLTKAAYQAVRVSGATGGRLSINLAKGDIDANSADTIGLVCETINTNQEGFIITVGQLIDINTTGSLQGETWADGDVLYLSPTTAGQLTNVKPNGSTGHIVVMGYVEYAHPNNGAIYVKVMNGWELDELHNVYINLPTTNQVLAYETGTPDLWKNKNIIDIAPTSLKTGSFGVTVDGVTTTVQVGQTGFVVMPYDGAITGWSITTNAVGSIQFDVWKDASINTIPTVTDSIVGGVYPTLTSGQFVTSTSIGSWTTSFSAGHVFGFYVNSVSSTVKNATLTIRTTKS
jgi:hypothetical protein